MITMCNIMQFNITTGISKTIYIFNLLFKNRYICLLYHKGALVSLILFRLLQKQNIFGGEWRSVTFILTFLWVCFIFVGFVQALFLFYNTCFKQLQGQLSKLGVEGHYNLHYNVYASLSLLFNCVQSVLGKWKDMTTCNITFT